MAQILGNLQLRFNLQQRTACMGQKLGEFPFELRPQPSAILLGTDTAARRTWFVKP
jgi:hypothetical protein